MVSTQPGDWLVGPFWPSPVQVVSIQSRHEYDVVTVHLADRKQSQPYVLTSVDWQYVQRVQQADRVNLSFDGDPLRFRLGMQAHLLRLAHSIDPYAALNASRVDPLPHQFEAVYEHLLARPVVRALLAHDAGAGKTIMSGLLIKELKRRQSIQRVLIVVPAGLTDQWRRELLTKFGEDFTLVNRSYMMQHRLDSLDVWRATSQAITSIDFARQKTMRRALESVEWDLVVVDEAHKMAAYMRPVITRTQAYELGETLARHTTHMLLMTATPHKGDPDNYRLLISLLDPVWGDAAWFTSGTHPMVLRRTKEEMHNVDGSPLYPERIVETLPYGLSVQEGTLLEQVQRFIRQRYSKAQKAHRNNTAFALLTLERRLASSAYALGESLRRIRTALEMRVLEAKTLPGNTQTEDVEDWEDWEELPEEERWEREVRAESSVASLIDSRQVNHEMQQIDSLIAQIETIIEAGQQEKITELRQACDLWVGERKEQLIIFTEFKDTLVYLYGQLEKWGYTTTQIHGGMPIHERRSAERTFWNGKAQVLIATEAAGEGINLQCCRVLINFDLPWNPCRLEQRMGRIHRYGQQADKIYVFNLLAYNSMEDEVKQALLDKMQQMRKDMGDKVFDVVGTLAWNSELRDILERIALGDKDAVQAAKQLIDRVGQTARQAIEAEERVATTGAPLDIAAFRRKQATFRAHRLSPEAAEKFFRRALPFLGGTLKEMQIVGEDGQEYAAFEVALPTDLRKHRRHSLRLSFWRVICSDDDTEPDAILFIAPGHWLFELLLDQVIERCNPDLSQGAVFCDLQPERETPSLVWFVQSHIRDGLSRHVRDVLATVLHRADEEQVMPLPGDVLDSFDEGSGAAIDTTIRRVRPMLAGQREVVDQCVQRRFVPTLLERRAEQHETFQHDRQFLEEGLTALADHLSEEALDAFSAGNEDEGNRLMDQSDEVRQRLANMLEDLTRSEHLLLVAPQVLGVALVLPAPMNVVSEPITTQGRQTHGKPMRRDPEVEAAAMKIVMDYETAQHRQPRDVHQGNSWDIESDDVYGVVVRYIEVKGRGPADADEVWLTEPEWEAARRLGDLYWLYIVRLSDRMMWMIQNPYARLQPKELKRWIVRLGDVVPHAEAISIGE